ncbi:class I adenylate-forming enzyme family protein [Streptomyces sp. NPDC048172]|uniref:class I adenylate-forming enzyme family protein n=1 Tax=Streptomyces sp. NPDC048172 TaxID=3365505 RepID=UPI003720DC08
MNGHGTYLDVVLAHWEKDEEAEALVEAGGGGRRMSRGEARRELFRMAHALRRWGLRPGDAVGAFTANGPEAVLTHLAVHLIGCRLVFLPSEPGPGELASLMERSGARAVIVSPEHHEQAERARARCAAPPPPLLSLEAEGLPALAAACPAEHPGPVPAAGDVVTVLYTGGTLGSPKLPAHGRLLYDVMAASGDGDAGQRVLVATSLTHSSGHLTMLHALLSGSTLVVLPEWDPAAAFTALRDEEIGVTGLVPPMLSQLLDEPRCRPGALPHLRQISTGAAPIAPARLRQAVEVFGRIVSQGYGQSECMAICALPPQDLPRSAEDPRWRSCGRPLPGTELEIRGEDGAALPPGEVGEVVVRSPVAMLGYAGDPDRTAETLRDGWLHTGDLGHRDEEGYLFLVDRARDVIVTGQGSDNVYSRLLDDFAASLPGVREAAGVGVPDARFGEAVRLFLVGDGVDTGAAADAVARELGELYRPRETVLLPRLPRTALHKIDKRALRALRAAGL